MSMEFVSPPLATPATAIRISPPRTVPALDRRRRLRRAEDRTQLALAQLVRWFIDRETQPHIVVDRRMFALHMNEAANLYLAHTAVIGVTDGKLSFASARHREVAEGVICGDATEASLTIRAGGSSSLISLRRMPVLRYGTPTFLITISPASRVDCERIQTEFGLTRAESEIAVSIFKGLSLVKIAKERASSINTVKSQARCIFQKCRVHSQVALTRMIGDMTMAKEPHS